MTETDVGQRVQCRWCKAQSPLGTTTCEQCGAPLDVREVVSDSGWREAPQLRPLTEIAFSSSTIQVDVGTVPVAEIRLDPADAVYFEHHAMLWKDGSIPMSVKQTPGGAQRLLGDLPFVLSVARGPGRIAFSRDAAGALRILTLEPGVELELRGHAMLLASDNVDFSFTKVGGVRTMLMAGTGMYLDRFTVASGKGIVVLHGYGNVFERLLGEGETVQLEPGGFLYKDSSVTMQVQNLDIGSAGGASGVQSAKQLAGRGLRGLKAMREMLSDGGVAGAAEKFMGGGGASLAQAVSSGTRMCLMTLTGPGRVGMQSMYEPKVTD